METIEKIAVVLAMIASICTITGVSIWGVASYVAARNKNDSETITEVQVPADEYFSENITREDVGSITEAMEEHSVDADLYSSEKESANSNLEETEEYFDRIAGSSDIDLQNDNNMSEKIDVEEEVKKIKRQYYKVQNQKDAPAQHPAGKEIKVYYMADELVSIEVLSGYNSIGYSRIYYYDVNGKLYFAFVFDKRKENRLYFKDDILIRYIDENNDIYNLYENLGTCIWQEIVLSEGYELLGAAR